MHDFHLVFNTYLQIPKEKAKLHSVSHMKCYVQYFMSLGERMNQKPSQAVPEHEDNDDDTTNLGFALPLGVVLGLLLGL